MSDDTGWTAAKTSVGAEVGTEAGTGVGTRAGGAAEDAAWSASMRGRPDSPWRADADHADPDADADAGRPSVVGLRVGRLLGRGGSSAVWLVTDDGGRRLALKVIAPVPAGAAEVRVAEHPGASIRHGRRAATGAAPLPASGAGAVGAVAPCPPSGAGTDELVRELRLLQRFTHDHLVRVHSIVETDRGPVC